MSRDVRPAGPPPHSNVVLQQAAPTVSMKPNILHAHAPQARHKVAASVLSQAAPTALMSRNILHARAHQDKHKAATSALGRVFPVAPMCAQATLCETAAEWLYKIAPRQDFLVTTVSVQISVSLQQLAHAQVPTSSTAAIP
jgi:hypothetical protein